MPRIIDFSTDGSWMLSERAYFAEPSGHEYVDMAFESAERIASAVHPAPPDAITTWRNPDRKGTLKRAFKLAFAGISPLLFIRARSAAAQLPDEVPCHFDFHTGNVLHTEPRPGDMIAAATIIDFEYLRMGPRHADKLRLITTLKSHADAAYGLDLLLQQTPKDQWSTIVIQLRWLALRPLAELIAADRKIDPALIKNARERWRLAQQWIKEINNARERADLPALSIDPSNTDTN